MSASTASHLRSIKTGERAPLLTYGGDFDVLYEQVLRLAGGQRRKTKRSHFVYFLKFSLPNDSLVKIGISWRPRTRIHGIIAHSPPFCDMAIRVLGIINVGGSFSAKVAETALVVGLREFHVRGEWLRLPLSVQKQISKTCYDVAVLDSDGHIDQLRLDEYRSFMDSFNANGYEREAS